MLQRRRAERSRQPFVLMLLDAAAFPDHGTAPRTLLSVSSIALKPTLEADLISAEVTGKIDKMQKRRCEDRR